MATRIYWIDYLKAFAIFLVVLGHSGLDSDSPLKAWIYGFHMPLFVFISGIFAHKHMPILQTLLKDAKALCIPYLFFSTLLIPFYSVIKYLAGMPHEDERILVTILQKLLMDDYYHCGPIWFLGAMLIIRTLYNAVNQIFTYRGGVTCFIICGLYFLNRFYDVHIFSIDSAMALFPYYVAGSFSQRGLTFGKQKGIFLLAILGIAMYSLICLENKGIDYDQMKFGQNIIKTYASGFLGCYSITLIFSHISTYQNPFLLNVGMNSLAILGLHSIFVQIFRFAYKIITTDELPIWYLVALSVMTLYLCSLISEWLVKYCPTLIGKNKQR